MTTSDDGGLIRYGSRTGTKKNLLTLRDNGWRLLISSEGVLRPEGFQYALDNGAWTSFQQKTPWNEAKFLKMCEELGEGADWVVLPDIVAGGMESFKQSMKWIPRLDWLRIPKLFAVQDGMTPKLVEDLVGPELGIFLGGSTDWKLGTMFEWGEFARDAGCHFHVGRVNTARRIHRCRFARAHSIDGTSVSRYSKNTLRLTRAAAQEILDF